MTGEQWFGAGISLALLLLSLLFARLLKAGDDRHTTAVQVHEKDLRDVKEALEKQIAAADARAEERLRHAREIVQSRLDEHGRQIDHLRAANRGNNNVISEMRSRIERLDAEDATIRRFARSREWREHRPREEDPHDS